MNDWIDNLWAFLQNNDTFTAWVSAIVSVLAVIGIPTILSMARTLANSKENKNYRGVTLVRILWISGFAVSVIAYLLSCLIEDKSYNAELSAAERIADVRAAALKRSKTLTARETRLNNLKKEAEAKYGDFATVPSPKKRK